MGKRLLSIVMATCLAATLIVPAVAVEPTAGTTTEITVDYTLSGSTTGGNFVVDEPVTITVTGAVTLTGTGDAFTINANTELVFEDGASLTLNGYDNAFVVENATLSGGGWVINDGDGMDLFRLKTGGELDITGNVELNGKDKTDATASRAIVLPGSSSGQAVTLGENVTLSANNFYRGVETGGASGYTISGDNMNNSVFDFSDNDCGMFISYFDSNVHFDDCKLEVSNCTTSGIFMRQDNASLDGLYLTNVFINCVNDELTGNQQDIAVRFHSTRFEFQNCNFNIEYACNTGLWVFDGWTSYEEGNIINNCNFTVKHVSQNVDLFGAAMHRKGITFNPTQNWYITNSTFTLQDCGEGGINIASNIQVQHDNIWAPNTWTATPTVYGGTIRMEDTKIYTSGIEYADIGVQVGQFLEIGQNVMIDNSNAERFTILCDNVENDFPASLLGMYHAVAYDVDDMPAEDIVAKRVTVTGGSYNSSDDENMWIIDDDPNCYVYEESIPINENGDRLTKFVVEPDDYTDFVLNGVINLIDSEGITYQYKAETACNDGNRYIWAPAVTVSFEGIADDYTVPCGAAFGLTAELPEGNWVQDNGEAFTADTQVTGDMNISLRSEG